MYKGREGGSGEVGKEGWEPPMKSSGDPLEQGHRPVSVHHRLLNVRTDRSLHQELSGLSRSRKSTRQTPTPPQQLRLH
jgi:hypothetical protein